LTLSTQPFIDHITEHTRRARTHSHESLRTFLPADIPASTT
jgi:hypothetical protein